METFEPGLRSVYTQYTFRVGERGMKCLACGKVMTITEWDEKRRCFCRSTNAVPAIAHSAPPTRLETNRRTGLNPSNINSNTPPRNPPIPTVNSRPTISNASSSSRNTAPLNSRSTNPSSSSRTQGSSSLSGWIYGVAIVAIAAALSPGMSAWFTAQFSQFTNNSTTQKNQQPPLTPKQVVKRYYQSATSNPEADLPFRSDGFKSYWKQKDQGNKTEEFFKKFQKVDVYSFQTLTQSSTKSKVRVWLKYVCKNNKTTCESQIMELIFAQSQGQWLINKVSDVEYNLDCGK